MPRFLEPFERWELDRVRSADASPVDGLLAPGELEVEGRRVLDFETVDVLGLALDARVREAAQAALRKFGPRGLRRLKGPRDLAARLAALTQREDAVVAHSPAALLLPLFEAADRLHLDVRASAPLRRLIEFGGGVGFTEAKAEAPSEDTGLWITPSVFPNEGDLADVETLRQLSAATGDGVLIDDSRGLGLLGEKGGGAAEQHGLEPSTLIFAELSGVLGARVSVLAGPRAVIERVRSTLEEDELPSPLAAAAALRALEVLEAEPQRRTRLWDLTERVLSALLGLGFDTGPSVTPTLPLWSGDEVRAERLGGELSAAGVQLGQSLLAGRARLLLQLRATHTDAQVDQALEQLTRLGRKAGLIDGVSRPVAEGAVVLARPGSFVRNRPAALHWSPAVPAADEAPSLGLPKLSGLFELPSREAAGRLFDAMETFTWRAANSGAADLRRLLERGKGLRRLLRGR